MSAPRDGVLRRTFSGRVLHVWFSTSTDLNAFLPAGLQAVDPHVGFVKAERLKIESTADEPAPPATSQYQQVCLTTLAHPAGLPERHRNLVMWEDRPWAVGGSLVAVKRLGEIEMTWLFDSDRQRIERGEAVPFDVDVRDAGRPALRFVGRLDGRDPVAAPPFNGFYVGGDDTGDLRLLSLHSSQLDSPWYGTGELSMTAEIGAAGPALADVRVQGCVVHDITFTRHYGADLTPVR